MPTTPEGDNRWTAILSADLVGFTEISQSIGAERVYELLTVVLGYARQAIEEHEGHVVDTAGDGILAAFGAPRALENASLSACRAALSFQSKLADARQRLETEFQTQVQFRTGIAGGNIMVARMEDGDIKVVGPAVNTVARLQVLALPNETLISDTIRRAAEGHIKTTDIGHVTLKGFPDPVQVHKLEGLAETVTKFDATRRRGITELVGRDSELDRIVTSFGGKDRPNVIVLRGPAGIGKSRLTHEVIETCGLRAYIGQCQPSAAARAYQPFTEIFRQASDAPWGAAPDAALAPLLAGNRDLKEEYDEIAAGDGSRDQTDRALRLRSLYLKTLQRIADTAPGLFVIEDVHWIDPSSGALMTRLVESGPKLLITARPEFRADWLQRPDVMVVDLAPLDDAAIARIATATIARKISPRIEKFVIDKAEGTPLVAEEIARALVQDQLLKVSGDSAELQRDPGIVLTGQLEQMVLSRVDRLSGRQQETIRYAAAMGRNFARNELEAALHRPADLADIAATPGLIERSGPGHWRFVHALIRDAVYASLLSAHRHEVHLKIAEAIEGSNALENGRSRTLAEHFLRSAEPKRAAPYLVRAAGESLGSYALQETDDLLGKAYDLVSATPDLLDDKAYGDLTVYWLRAMDCMGDFGRGMALSERLMPRLEAMGYSPSLSIARMLTTIALTHAWKYDEAQHLAETTLEEAESQGDAWGAAWARVALMRILDETKRADIATIERLAAQIEPVAEQTDDRHMAMTAQYLLSSAYRSTGRRIKALAQARKIETYSVTHNDRRAMGYAKWARALIHAIEGHPEQTRAAIKDAGDYVIPGSGDERVSLGIEYYCDTLLSPPSEVSTRIAVLEDEAHRMVDRNIKGSMAFTGALADLRAGELARGWRKLQDLENYIGATGNVNLLHQVYATRCEVLLSIAGLIYPENEAVSKPPAFQRKRPGLSDMVTYLYLRVRALKLAEQNINASLALSQSYSNPHLARYKIALGLIRVAQKQQAAGRQLLDEGYAIADSEGLEILAKRAQSALGAL
jgi:class 3 adenylate cyclase